MKRIHIKAKPFFDLLKTKNQSMWEMFAQLVNGKEQEIIFLDEEEKVLFNFILPKTTQELVSTQKEFSEEFKRKIQKLYN